LDILTKAEYSYSHQYSEFGSIQDWRIQGADPKRPWNIAGASKVQISGSLGILNCVASAFKKDSRENER